MDTITIHAEILLAAFKQEVQSATRVVPTWNALQSQTHWHAIISCPDRNFDQPRALCVASHHAVGWAEGRRMSPSTWA
jgi:hypothetical protein